MPTTFNSINQQTNAKEQQEPIIITSEEKEEKEEQFHPIACKNCRKVHKKCDKKLPSCSSCLSRGFTCIYAIPKRKPKKQNRKINENLQVDSSSTTTIRERNTEMISSSLSQSRFQPYPTVLNQSSSSSLSQPLPLSDNYSSSTSSNTSNTNLLEIFKRNEEEINKNPPKLRYIKQNIELSLAFLKEQMLSFYRLIIHPQSPVGVFDSLITSPNPTIEGQALLYAIHSNIEQRLGASMKRQSDFIENTKSLLGLVSYDRSNIRVLLTQYFLSHSLLSNGKFKDALFYLNQMNYAIEELNSKDKELEYEERVLLKINEFAKMEINNAITIDRENLVQNITFHNFLTGPFGYVSSHIPPFSTLFPPGSMTRENLHIHLETIDKVTYFITFYLSSHCGDRLKGTKIGVADLMSLLMKNTMKILCIKDIDSMEFGMIINLCNESIKATNSEYFDFLPSKIIHAICVTANEVIRIIKYFQTFNVTDMKCLDIDLFELLQQYLNVTKKLAAKYKRIELYYSYLIKEIEVVLATKLCTEINININNTVDNTIERINSTYDSGFQFGVNSPFELLTNDSENSLNNINTDEALLFDVSAEVDNLLKDIIDK